MRPQIGKFPLIMAWRYIRGVRGFASVMALFSFAGIAVGVATLIVVMSVMNGFREQLMEKILGISSHIVVRGGHQPLDQQTVRHIIKDVPTQRHQVFIERQGLIMFHNQSAGIWLRGIDHDDSHHSITLIQGNWNGLVVGEGLFHRLSMKIGDSVSLVLPDLHPTGFGFMPKVRSLPVTGCFRAGIPDYDTMGLFLPLVMAQKLTLLSDHQYSGVEIWLPSADNASKIKQHIQDTWPHVRCTDWQDMNGAFFSAIQMEKTVMRVILTLMVIVAALNVISSLMMMVSQKTAAIAILRTLGATRLQISCIFILSGMLVGTVGSLVGVGAGVWISRHIDCLRRILENLWNVSVFSPEVYWLSQVPSHLHASDVLWTMIVAWILSFVAGIYPAWQAQKLSPIEGLSCRDF